MFHVSLADQSGINALHFKLVNWDSVENLLPDDLQGEEDSDQQQHVPDSP